MDDPLAPDFPELLEMVFFQSALGDLLNDVDSLSNELATHASRCPASAF